MYLKYTFLKEGMTMLSKDQMNAIKQSAPLLKAEGTKLVTVFYQNMIRQKTQNYSINLIKQTS